MKFILISAHNAKKLVLNLWRETQAPRAAVRVIVELIPVLTAVINSRHKNVYRTH